MKSTWWVSKEDLIDEQANVVELPLEGSYLVLGPPGSGKTNLLLLRASYLTFAGRPNIAVLVFTRTLQEFIRAGATQYDFPPDKVRTHLSWGLSVLRAYGINLTLPGNFDDQRKLVLDELTGLANSRQLANIYNCLLLDEAQDYWPEELLMFDRLSEHVFIVADPKQKIYSGAESIEIAKSFVEETVTLKHHFRNGLNICKLADAIAKDQENYEPMEPTANYDEAQRPSTVERHAEMTLDDQIGAMLTKLDLQLKAYPGEMIGLTCPRRSQLSKLWDAVSSSNLANVAVLQRQNEYSPFGENTQICVSTCHAAKGLEFRAMHLLGADKIRGMSNQRNLAFTAVTRTKTSLDIYHDARLPGFFEAAFAKLNPVIELPTLGDLFGKVK